MKTFLLRTAFVIAVTVLTFVLLVPASLLLEAFSARFLGRGSYQPSGLLPAIVMIYACLYAANRIVSDLFGRTGISDKRWSVLSRRTFG